MSQTVRLFVNDKRISTAVTTKKGDFLQVYPMKKAFPCEEAWRISWRHETHPEVVVKSERSLMLPTKKKSATTKGINATLTSKNWSYKEVYRYKAPAGEYYIGDLCYVLGDEIYDKVFGGQGYEMGLYTQEGTGNFFFVDHTAYGDGLYISSDDREFAVDAAIIGITPVSCMAKNDGGGQIYSFKDPVECIFKNGCFTFVSGYNQVVINTGASENDDY